MIHFTNAHALGFLPMFFSEDDERSARDQLDANYQHGGGVLPSQGFTMNLDREYPAKTTMSYPEDPDLRVVGWAKLRDELILVCEYAYVVIVQPDDSFIITRCD